MSDPFSERQRLLEAQRLLRALEAPAPVIAALAPKVAADPGPVEEAVVRLLHRIEALVLVPLALL